MILSHDPHVDLKIFAGALDPFAAYLQSSALVRPVTVVVGTATYQPAISIGFFVDLRRELGLRAAALSADEQATLQQLGAAMDADATRNPAGYAAHLQRELKSLLDLWRAYLDDLAAGETSGAANYAAEARKRTRIAHLLADAGARRIVAADAEARAARLDERLDSTLQAGDYCGPEGLAAAYPEASYPWLYRRPRGRR